MDEFDAAVACVKQQSSEHEAIVAAMRRCAATEEVAKGIRTLRSATHSASTTPSFYLDFRALPLVRRNGWTLGLARIIAPPAATSAPTAESATLCIEATGPLTFDIYEDSVGYDTNDLRPEQPIRHVGEQIVGEGDVVVLRGAQRWLAPRGTIDATFLKLEGPAQRPLSIAFDRQTLMPTHAGFADQTHTGRDFFGTLMAALTAPTEPLAEHMSAKERESLIAFLLDQGTDTGLHLTTRWKYIQALGRLDAAKVVTPLTQIARDSRSVIGDRARSTLATYQARNA